METELSANVVTGYVIVAVMQWAKKQRWIPMIDFDTAKANRIIAAVMALAASVGIHAKYNGEDGSLLVTGLTLGTILPLAGEWLRQFIMQQLIYKGAGFEARSEVASGPSGVDPKRFRSDAGSAGAALLMGIALVLSAGTLASGCGATLKSPVITAEDQAQVRAGATKALAGLEIAGIVVRDSMLLVNDLRAAGLVSPELRETIAAVVRQTSDAVLSIIPQIADATRTATIDGLVKSATSAFLAVADVLEKQSDQRLQTAGRFVRVAAGAIALVGGAR